MNTKRGARLVPFLALALSLLATLAYGCKGETKVETVIEEKVITVVETVVGKETIIQERVLAVTATLAPTPSPMPKPTAASGAGESVGHAPSASADYQPTQRLIIKDAVLDLEVEDTDRAVDRITQVARDLRGYIISQRVWYRGEAKYATISLAVPVQDFENALNRLRVLATRVLDESASGQDVTDQYVDLQSRLRNLQATRDRIRGFLDQAQDVDEALAVNRELSDIEGQIEQVQGRLNYLRDRAAFSTITISLTPVDQAPEPESDDAWRPGETAQEAIDKLISLLQGLVDQIIWFVIVPGPFVLILSLLLWLFVRRLRRRWAAWKARRSATQQETPTGAP